MNHFAYLFVFCIDMLTSARSGQDFQDFKILLSTKTPTGV